MNDEVTARYDHGCMTCIYYYDHMKDYLILQVLCFADDDSAFIQQQYACAIVFAFSLVWLKDVAIGWLRVR